MSEFEIEKNYEKWKLSSSSCQKQAFPDDFTGEDQAFAAELHTLFSPEEEELPPYYVKTLLSMENQRFEPTEHGIEYKTNARVFQRLKLRRRLFSSHASPLSALYTGISGVSMGRSVLALVATFGLIMVLTVALTGESFVTGFAILLRGTHGSGVYATNHYPLGMLQQIQYGEQNAYDSTARALSFLDAEQQVLFQTYWPQYTPAPYVLRHINLYVGLDQQWADGPMLEFEYSLPPSSVAPRGTGEVWVREFKPKEDVLQLVNDGASLPIDMDQSGRALAIYVDGQWSPRGKEPPEWVYGNRSELIYQINGVLFWIVGDQRDNVGKTQLMQIAQGLAPSLLNEHFHLAKISMVVIQTSEDVPGPFSNDVIEVFPNDSSGQPSYVSVSSYQPPKGNSQAP